MYRRSYEDLVGMLVITADARNLGTISDLKYDHKEWTVTQFRVSLNKGLEKELAIGKGRSALIPVGSTAKASDVVLLGCDLSCVKDIVVPDSDNIATLSTFIGKTVVTSENLSVGSAESLSVDLEEDWRITNLKVRVEKTMVEPLGLKKGLLGKTPLIAVKTDDVNLVGDMAFLSKNLEELKKEVSVYE